MNDIILISVSALLLAIIMIVSTLLIIKKIQNDRYKKEIEKLDFERNSIVGVAILTELAKVKDLVKTDNLKNKLNEWDTTFKLIKDDRVPKLSDLIAEADFLLSKREYLGTVKKIANIEMEIRELKTKSNVLLDEIKVITNSEERNRSKITKLKVIFRELQSRFEKTKKDYGEIINSLVLQFETMEKHFADFEEAMELNDYVQVEKIVNNLEELVNNTKMLLEETPSIVLMAQMLIPKKIEEVSINYARMIRDGYPLDYLNVEYNIKEINAKVQTIMDRLKMLNIEDASLELRTILDYFDILNKDFDKEKECKNLFIDNSKAFRVKIEKIDNVVRDIYLSLDDIRMTYDLKDEDINKFNALNKELEILNSDFKALVDHGRGRTFAYSKLVDELDGLNNKLDRLQDDLDYQLHSISSMKDDEYRAKEQLDAIQKLLKQSKMRMRDYKIPVIPSVYFVELREAQDAIREIIKELEKKPIVIRVLNIRVDTARDLVFKIYNKTNELIKIVMMAERIIIYGNRYRSSYLEINNSLEKAEVLFKKGMYQESLDVSVKAIETVENNIREKLGML